MTEDGLTQEQLEALVRRYQTANRLARNVLNYGWNNLSVYDEVDLSNGSVVAKMAHKLIDKRFVDPDQFQFNLLKKWENQIQNLSSRDEKIIREGFSPEEQEVQNVKCEFAKSIAKAIALEAQIHGSRFDENSSLPKNPELRAMVETYLYPLLGKSKDYESAAYTQWMLSEQGIFRASQFRMSTHAVEGELEIKEYPIDSLHLTGRTVGIHETRLRKKLSNSIFYNLSDKIEDYLKSYGCPAEKAQEFCKTLQKFYYSHYEDIHPE